jgi:hypothetical protein
MRKNVVLPIGLMLILATSATFTPPEEKVIADLTNKMNLFSTKIHSENVYIQTDKDYYRPGENIWFTAFITDALNNKPSNLSKKMYFKILDNKGLEVYSDVFQVNESRVNDCYTLPPDLKEGKYLITAFTSWMKNGDISRVFTKGLWISSAKLPKIIVSAKTDKPIYLPGTEMILDIETLTPAGMTIADAELTISLCAAKNTIYKGLAKTDANGKSHSSIPIPENLSATNFTLKIDAKSPIGKGSIENILPIAQREVKVNFHPEGGNMVQGIKGKVAFSVSTKEGFPIDCSGEIVDETGKIITNFGTSINGMGFFYLNPSSSSNYSLKITKPAGFKEEFKLPSAQSSGMTLALVNQDQTSVTMKVRTNSTKEEKFLLLGDARGLPCWAVSGKVTKESSFAVPMNKFPIGVARVSLFDTTGKLLAVRQFFANKQQLVKISITELQSQYSPREKVTFKIKAIDKEGKPVQMKMAVTAVNDLRLQPSEDRNSILSAIYLNQEFTEYIPYLSSYLTMDVESEKALNLVLMNYESSHYKWEKILDQNLESLANYRNQDNPSGWILDLNRQPIPEAKVSLMNLNNMQSFQGKSDKTGYFEFANIEEGNYSLNAESPKNGKDFQVVLSEEMFFTGFMHQYFDKLFSAIENQRSGAYWPIKNPFKSPKKPVPQKIDAQKNIATKSYPSDMSIMDIIMRKKSYHLVNNKIVFYGSENSIMFQDGALIVIDGVKIGTDPSILNTIPTEDLEQVNVSTNVMDIQKYTGLNNVGVIEIFTKRGIENTANLMNSADFNGIKQTYREFQSPNYEKGKGKGSDYRTTIYWNPTLQTDASGEATVTFWNPDIKSKVIISVNGLDQNGIPGFAEASYSVN